MTCNGFIVSLSGRVDERRGGESKSEREGVGKRGERRCAPRSFYPIRVALCGQPNNNVWWTRNHASNAVAGIAGALFSCFAKRVLTSEVRPQILCTGTDRARLKQEAPVHSKVLIRTWNAKVRAKDREC